MPLRRLLPIAVAAFLIVLTGCERAAELIPGEAPAPAAETPVPTATPLATGPILVTPSLELGGGQAATAAAVTDEALARSVVQIRVIDERRGRAAMLRDGSGVVVDVAGRLIATSYPLVMPVSPSGERAYTAITVATSGEDGTPQERFEAEIVAADPAAEVAVLRVVRGMDGQALRGSEFDLPAVELSSGGNMMAGDPVRLFGYPGLDAGDEDSQALTVTHASITGFRGEAGRAGNAWLKTDARLPYGAQGGPAFGDSGRLLGVIVQSVYDGDVPVSQVRPLSLLEPVIERARGAGPAARYEVPLTVRGGLTTPPHAGDGTWVSPPAFAESAIERPTGVDLFDYRQVFPGGLSTIHYEFVAQGVPEGALVEERWYLGGVLQDQLSISYPWDRGPFAIVADRITTPNPAGFPNGNWRLEIWVDGERLARSTARLGGDPATYVIQPSDVEFGSTATADGEADAPASADASQILFFFTYSGMDDVQSIRWLVFHNSRIVHTSPDVRWSGGSSGRWWVGYADAGSVGPGTWEFELHVDGDVVLARKVTLD